MKNNSPLNIFLFSALALLSSAPASAALVLNSAQAITHTVTVQPIIVSDSLVDGGGNTATYFGNAAQQTSIEGLIDDIWAQAGIDVNFLASNSWNNTFANWGAGGAPDNGGNTRLTADLSTIRADGIAASVTHANPNVINMFFVSIAAGFDLLTANQVAGLAYLGDNGVTQYVGSSLLSFTGGQEAIASVVAHEIGHNLGLEHSNAAYPSELDNLMRTAGTGGNGERLNNAQIALALGSNLSVVTAVPLPAAFWFLGSGLIGLISFSKSKKS